MGFQVSPGVEVKEIDLTNVIPAVSTSIGGFAGPFRWGPVEEIQLVSSEKELASVLGKPSAFLAESFFTASSFLKYGNALKTVRTSSDQLKNAVSGEVSVNTGGISAVNVNGSLASGLVSGVALTVAGGDGNASLTAEYEIDSVSINTEGSDFDSTDIVEGETLTADLGGEIVTLTVGTVDLVSSPNVIALSVTSSNTFANVPASVSGIATVNNEDSPAVALNDLTLDFTFAATSVVVNTPGADYDLPNTEILVNGVAAPAVYTFTEVISTIAEGLLIKNETHFESGITLRGALYARYAGVLGNSIQVDIFDTTAFAADDTVGNLSQYFDTAPSAGEYHIIVTDVNGELTGTAGSVLETWAFVGTTDGDKKEDGSNNYYVDVINQNSNYFYVGSGVAAGTHSFTLGVDQTTIVAGDIKSGIDLFADAETVDVNLIFASNDVNGSKEIAEHLILVANNRKDVVAFCSPPIEDSTGNSPLVDVKTWCDTITSTSYAVLDSTAIYTYNKYADKYLYIPACGHVAGLCANTDDVAEPWFSPAGYNRGQLLGITKLAYNPKQAERDELYKARINPIVSFPGQGTILFGDKTAQAKPSAFDRINVRRLFIVLEKAIATAAKYQLFELNDQFTRAMFRNMTEPFLRDIKGRRGVTDFLVVCDETNNTGEVIDTNRFVADIYIKPARSINFITLNFIATRTGVEFSEIVGK
jgi:phage tail sheath protein FI